MQIIPFFHQRRFGEWPASQASDWHQQTWVWYDSLFYSIQLSLRKFWFDTTHDSQWRYRNWFKSTEYSKCISEIFSNQLMTQKKLSESWIESTHDTMMLFIPSFIWPFLGIQPFFENLFLFWAFNSTVDLVTYFGDLFWRLGTQVLTSCDLLRVFDSNAFPTNWFESAHDWSSISET